MSRQIALSIGAALLAALQSGCWDPNHLMWFQMDHSPKKYAPPTATAPQQAASTDVIKGWVESQKGLGNPEYLDSVQKDMRVFVAWNIPTSGFNGTDFWVYCHPDAISRWHLEASSQFVPAGDQAHSAAVDPALHELRFLGKDGQIYHRVSLASCVAQPHGNAGPPG